MRNGQVDTSASPTVPQDDERWLGPYRLLEEIAGGGSGNVFRAASADGQPFAIKVLSAEAAQDETRLLRFYQEGRSLLQVDHPNLIRAHEIAEDRGQHYLAMEYVDGRSLADFVMKRGRIAEASALRIAIQIARGLQAAHEKGIIHRDVSPKNILIGSGSVVKLGDFEFSKQSEMDLDLTVQGTGLGTPDFMSPEQFRKAKDVDSRSDVYSLGATLYVMLTARLPFPGETLMDKWLAKAKNHFLPPETLNRSICGATVELIKSAMAADPDQRPKSAEQFADLAEQCLIRLEAKRGKREHVAAQTVARWRLVLISDHGEARTVKATYEQIEQLVRRKRISADARVAPEGTKRFHRLADVAEFRHLFRKSIMPQSVRPAAARINQYPRRLLGLLGRLLQQLGRAMSAADQS